MSAANTASRSFSVRTSWDTRVSFNACAARSVSRKSSALTGLAVTIGMEVVACLAADLRVPGGDDHVDLQPHQLGRECPKLPGLPLGRSNLHDQVLPFHVPPPTERVQEGVVEGRRHRPRPGVQHAHSAHLARLLRLSSEWRGEQDQDQEKPDRDHGAPSSASGPTGASVPVRVRAGAACRRCHDGRAGMPFTLQLSAMRDVSRPIATLPTRCPRRLCRTAS
jgi:hypothetical protein